MKPIREKGIFFGLIVKEIEEGLLSGSTPPLSLQHS